MAIQLKPAVSVVPCKSCTGNSECLGGLLCARERPGGLAGTFLEVARGTHLFRAEDRPNALFIVRRGAVKSYLISADGEEHVLGFHLPGDVVGLHAVTGEEAGCGAVALTDTEICKLPAEVVLQSCAAAPQAQVNLLSRMGREIQRLQSMLKLERLNADQRLAAFLLSQARKQPNNASGRVAKGQAGSPRMANPGFLARQEVEPRTYCGERSESEAQRRTRPMDGPRNAKTERLVVALPMSRSEIGRFLDLATETVSRMFTRLQGLGLIRVERNTVMLLDVAGLMRLARPEAVEPGRASAEPALCAA